MTPVPNGINIFVKAAGLFVKHCCDGNAGSVK